MKRAQCRRRAEKGRGRRKNKSDGRLYAFSQQLSTIDAQKHTNKHSKKAANILKNRQKEEKNRRKIFFAFFVGVWYNTNMHDYLSAIERGETGEKFEIFYRMLAEWNEKFNITRIVNEEDCKVKHFLDSLCGEKYFPQGANCCEVGSGGGFPSVPLMIFRPDLRFCLIESSAKKCAFLKEVIGALDLNAQTECTRAEEAAHLARFREKFDVCCARAVARMNTLSEYCAPFVKKGGLFIAYKGDAAEEIKEASSAFAVLGLKLKEAIPFELPQGAGKRTIAVCEKIKNTPPAYPRGRGKERSKPL